MFLGLVSGNLINCICLASGLVLFGYFRELVDGNIKKTINLMGGALMNLVH